MIESYDIVPCISQRETNKIYFEKRKEIKNLIKNMNTFLDNNSSTFFLSLYYMDLIFENYSLDEIMIESMNKYSIISENIYKINNYVLLSLACLVIASKYNEKDPHVPDLNSFLRVYNKCSKFYFIFSLNDLMEAEVNVLKTLKYKLNYFSLYQYFTFFFANGIILQQNIQESELIMKYKFSEKKILEKIYVKSREILDYFIDDYEKYYILFNGKENYITAIEILKWSIEKILNIQFTNSQNLFSLYYHININYNRHIEIFSIIENMLNKNETINRNISNNINYNYNYNFNYGNNFIDSQMSIIKTNNKNPISVSNNDTNFDETYKNKKILSDYKSKNTKAFYTFKDNSNINEYYTQIKNNNQMDSDNTNILTSKLSYQKYQQNSDRINDNNENKNINSMSAYMIPIMSKESNEPKQRHSRLKKSDICRNLTKELITNNFKENDISERKSFYRNYTKKMNISKNIFKSVNNFNELNPSNSNKKNYEKKNNYLNNINFIAKKNNKDGKTTNKRNINIDYNNSSKSTFYKSWLNNTNPSPKDILNKTKKIFDETNKRIIDFDNNNNEESSNLNMNNYTNKSNFNDNLKDINNNYNDIRNKSNKKFNSNFTDKNNPYQFKNDPIINKISKMKEEKSKENTIIINNNIQINNYLDKENNFSNYYNNSQQNISNIENFNFENYINKKYFNINLNNKNIYLNNNFIKNKKLTKDKNRKKINFKKINFLEEINEQLKENNKNNNNAFNNIIKKDKENIKINKDKDNRIINLSQFQTYFDYSSHNKYKGLDSSQKDFNYSKNINYSLIETNNKNYSKYNNLVLNDILNNKTGDINNSNIYEEYNKLNSEYIV